jgi:hypothetical protein
LLFELSYCVPCGVFFFNVGTLLVLGLELVMPLLVTPCYEARSSLPSPWVLSSASEKSDVSVGHLFVVAAWDVKIIYV